MSNEAPIKITINENVKRWLDDFSPNSNPLDGILTPRRQGTGTAWVGEVEPTVAQILVDLFRSGAKVIRDNKAANRGTGKLALAKSLERAATRIETKIQPVESFALTPDGTPPPFTADVRGLVCKGKAMDDIDAAVAKCRDAIMEPKLDGWRGLLVIRDGVAKMHTGNGGDKSGRLLRIEAAATHAFGELGTTILDGEVIDKDGASGEWGGVQTIMSADPGKHSDEGIQFVVFDLIAFNGWDARTLPFSARRKRLEEMFDGVLENTELHWTAGSGIRLIPQFEPTEQNHMDIVAHGYEGSMVKCLDALYHSGKRGKGCFKLKPQQTEDFVILRAIEAGGSMAGKLGAFEYGTPDGKIVGRVGTGFTVKQRDDYWRRRDELTFLVIEIALMGRVGSTDNPPRHPVFKRFRPDKTPEEIGS